MAHVCTFLIRGIAPYSQSKPHLTEKTDNESYDDFRKRTWREHLHADKNGEVFIHPGAIKNCLSEAAKFMNIGVPGKGKATYTKHFEAGIAVVKPVMLGIKKADVQSETLFLPADGRRGSGKRIWKQYPMILDWKGDVEVVVLDETCLHTSQKSGNTILQDVIEGGGQYIGLGRFRPRQNGYYGRYVIENFAVVPMMAKAA